MSELGIDPRNVTPEEFAGLIANADDDQIVEVVHAVGADQVLDRIFEGMQESFRPDRAQGLNAKIQFVVTDDNDEHRYRVEIEGGTCRAGRGDTDDPRVTIKTDVLNFSKLVTGQAQGPQLFMAGKLKISGDLMFSAQVMNFFDRPEPA
jgi:putative sterol carrier protein